MLQSFLLGQDKSSFLTHLVSSRIPQINSMVVGDPMSFFPKALCTGYLPTFAPEMD